MGTSRDRMHRCHGEVAGYFTTVLGIAGMASFKRVEHCLHIFAIDSQMGSLAVDLFFDNPNQSTFLIEMESRQLSFPFK